MKQIRLNKETDFTPSQLRDYLNKTFTTKVSGRPFTNSDIYQYSKRGKLPDEYGGYEIKIIEDEKIGIKVLRVNFEK